MRTVVKPASCRGGLQVRGQVHSGPGCRGREDPHRLPRGRRADRWRPQGRSQREARPCDPRDRNGEAPNRLADRPRGPPNSRRPASRATRSRTPNGRRETTYRRKQRAFQTAALERQPSVGGVVEHCSSTRAHDALSGDRRRSHHGRTLSPAPARRPDQRPGPSSALDPRARPQHRNHGRASPEP